MDSLLLRQQLATECSRKHPDQQRIDDLREQIREAVLAGWVERQLAAAPPLSQETRDRLAALLSGADTTAA